MTQQAIGAGRRRVLFGLLDGEGWTWASIKAAFWFVVIVMLLGYIPDRAYYFTVFPTIDLGVLVWSPVNFCPPTNRSLPCPPPVGATLPWDPSPTQLALPAGRTGGTVVQLGLNLVYVGGSDGTAPTDSTFTAPLYSGTFGPWQTGLALPAARSSAAVAAFNNSVYVVGGNGPDGKPTDTVFVAQQDVSTAQMGAFKPSDALKLPEARSDAAIVVASDGLILIGGTNGTAPQPTVWKAAVDKNGNLTAWAPQQALPTGLSATTAAIVGDYLFVYGGQTSSGPTNAVYRGTVSKDTATLGKVTQWATATEQTAARINLPAPRARARRVLRERRAVPRRRGRFERTATPVVLDRARRQGRDQRLAAPRCHGPADRRCRVDGDRERIAGLPHRRDYERPGRPRRERPGQSRPAATVLPARPVRVDGPRAQDRR